VPRDTQEGDVVSQFIGSSIPFIVRLSKEGKPKVRESATWVKVLDSVRKSAASESSLDSLDLQIKRALEEKTAENQDAEVMHCSLVGECFVDGLMQRDLRAADGGKSKSPRIVLALH
jgi:hypothetical protein